MAGNIECKLDAALVCSINEFLFNYFVTVLRTVAEVVQVVTKTAAAAKKGSRRCRQAGNSAESQETEYLTIEYHPSR